jgi:hypothetical protein
MKTNLATSILIPPSAGPVERCWMLMRSQTFRQLPLETTLSLPIPGKQDNRLYLMAFYYGVKRIKGPGTGHILPPIARVSVVYPDGRLLSFTHRNVEELFPGLPNVGDLGPLSASPASPNEKMQTRRSLFNGYTKILELYQQDKGTLVERQAFSKLFLGVAESALLPFYRALNPEFFQWLKKKK